MGSDAPRPTPEAPKSAPEPEKSTDERANRERRRQLDGLGAEVAQKRAEALIGPDVQNASTDKLLKAEEKEEGILAYEFTSEIKREPKTKEARSHLSPEAVTLKEDFHEGDVITVDFKKNNQAEWNIGAGDMLPPTVRQITVTDTKGNVRTSTRRVGLKGGFFDDEGYIPVFSGYIVKIRQLFSEAELANLRKPNGKWDREKYKERYDADDQKYLKKRYQKTYGIEWKGERIDAETVERLQRKSGFERGENLTALLERKPNYKEAATKATELYGVPTNTIFAFIKYESAFNEYAAARTSSARGLGQFLDNTWEGFIKDIKKDGHKDHALYAKMMSDPEWGKRDPREWRFNPEVSIHAVAWYTEKNALALHIEFSDTFNLYMAHHEGAGGYQAYQRYRTLTDSHPDWSREKLGHAAHLAGFQMDRIRAGNDPFAAVKAYAQKVAATAGEYASELSQ